MLVLTLLLILASAFLDVGYSKPHEWDTPRCKHDDQDCLVKTVNYYIKNGANGIPSINLIPIDPLFVPEIEIYQGDESPVSINLKLTNATFRGFSNLSMNKVSGFARSLKDAKFELFGVIPKLTISGQYTVNGNVIIFPVVGNGTAVITYENLDTYARVIPRIVTKKNKDYVDIKSLKIDVNTTRIHMNFDNVFNGDKRLSDAINQFINENWSDIFTELKPVMIKVTTAIISNILKPIFDKFPYNDIFLD